VKLLMPFTVLALPAFCSRSLGSLNRSFKFGPRGRANLMCDDDNNLDDTRLTRATTAMIRTQPNFAPNHHATTPDPTSPEARPTSRRHFLCSYWRMAYDRALVFLQVAELLDAGRVLCVETRLFDFGLMDRLDPGRLLPLALLFGAAPFIRSFEPCLFFIARAPLNIEPGERGSLDLPLPLRFPFLLLTFDDLGKFATRPRRHNLRLRSYLPHGGPQTRAKLFA
jgi:hypothetical protein